MFSCPTSYRHGVVCTIRYLIKNSNVFLSYFLQDMMDLDVAELTMLLQGYKGERTVEQVIIRVECVYD